MSDGAILDLVSRGKKDAYQIQDPVRTWFGSPYERRSPETREIRLLYPDNPPRFGQSFDIVLPSDGDILTSFDLRIQMPTWLPPSVVPLNVAPNVVKVLSHPYEILASPNIGGGPWTPVLVDASATQYGWCNGIANYMISRWAFYADTIIIAEGYGEFNAWFPDMDTTQMRAPLLHQATGRHNGSPAAIQANATPPELVFRVPIPGCQKKGDTGLPLCAFKHQKVYLRVWLLDKTQLVESAGLVGPAGQTYGLPLYELYPAPWGRRPIYVNGVLTDVTLDARVMGQPYIYARTGILNVENELRKSLAAQKFEIRFRQQKRDYWGIDGADYVPNINYRRVIQLSGFFQSMYLYFRSVARTKQNKYADILPTNPVSNVLTEWISTLALNVNSNDRIYPWNPEEFRPLANKTQLGRDVNVALYYLIFGISPNDEPDGTLNLKRCQKTVLNAVFNPVQVDPMTASNTTYATLLGLSWNILDINGGQATLRFPD